MKRFLFLLALINFCALASTKYFEIGDIEVKQRGGNSLIAKQNALHRAVRSAFKKIVEIQTAGKFSSFESISHQQIQNCVYDYSIDQEKFSDSVYIGRISYRFYKSKIAALLKPYGANIDVGESENKSEMARFAVYLKDFIRHAKSLRDLNVTVEKFSNDRVIFGIKKKRVEDFRELRIKYAQLT
ncbi:MAG: hypothetical protein LBO02_01955 [Holosporaceae bacterium]|jgi:hypothetical protein|nr:hypothetical protein [Holosporaceae bacterium]